MSNQSQWDAIDAANNSPPPAGAPEGMAPSTVNDTMRAMMGALARTYTDQKGITATTGTSTDYDLATSSNNAAVSDIGLTCFRVHTTNTGPATLNVDGLGGKPISATGVAVEAGALTANEIICLNYNPVGDRFDLMGGFRAGIADGGTGAQNAADARTNLGVQQQSTELDEIAALPTTDGNIIVGNGAAWVAEANATARASLGVSIGSDVQAWDPELDEIAALANTNGNFIVGNGAVWIAESGATARASMGVTDEFVEDIVGAMLVGNITAAIDVTYQDGDGTIDFVVDLSEVVSLTGPMAGTDEFIVLDAGVQKRVEINNLTIPVTNVPGGYTYTNADMNEDHTYTGSGNNWSLNAGVGTTGKGLLIVNNGTANGPTIIGSATVESASGNLTVKQDGIAFLFCTAPNFWKMSGDLI